MDDTIPIGDARVMNVVLDAAADSTPVRHYRDAMRAQAAEWKRAIDDFEMAEGGGVIEMAGTLVHGMRILANNGEWIEVIRKTRGDDFSYQCEDDHSPRPVYRSFMGASSPVVVRR